MDFNDLSAKLKRLFVALDEQYDENISSNIMDTHTSFDDGRFLHRTTFGSNSPEQNQYIVINAIHHISSLKDIIKQRLVTAGEDPLKYEQLINGNLPLALVTDLDNKDKHGDPLTRQARTNKDPSIVDVQQALRGRGITNASFTTNIITGKTTLNSVDGDVKVVVDASVIDSAGNLIMPLESMLEESYQLIENFLIANKLL